MRVGLSHHTPFKEGSEYLGHDFFFLFASFFSLGLNEEFLFIILSIDSPPSVGAHLTFNLPFLKERPSASEKKVICYCIIER